MKKLQKPWTEKENNYLLENYGKIRTKKIAENLDRTYQSIKSRATKVLKLDYGNRFENKFSPLLNDTIENWYWYGFIIGDGNFSKSYLRVTLHKDDLNHLLKLSNKLNSIIQIKNNYSTLCIGDSSNFELLKTKLGVSVNNKTQNSIKFPTINDELFFSYIIGLIDADGCIEIRKNKASQLKIELYHTWLENLTIIQSFLKNYLNIDSKVLINNRGYALFRISGHKNILKIKKKAQELKISYLDRKWINILEDTRGCNFYREIENEIIRLYREGNSLHKISKILNVNYNSLFNHKKEILEKMKNEDIL